ncbi:MAG: signal peptide peptidase SppA [Actinomycetota bacterium]|nr:signal peptide peptidase SppA [Actinomycetota bacterium]
MDDQGTIPPAGNDQHAHEPAPPSVTGGETQGYPLANGPTTTSAPPPGADVPPQQPPAPPQQQYGPASQPPAGQPPVAKSSTGWKILAAIIAVMFICAIACCGLSIAAVGSAGSGGSAAFGEAIAVIHIDGIIAGTGSSMNGVISPEEFLGKLDQAADDSNVKAVLLRVDSPGGTVAASQEIATEIARFEKPVVVSIGDVGASGAYMVASQCDEIVANRTSTVGSIGVIAEIPNVARLLEKVGVEFTVLTAGEYKGAGSPYRSLSASETALMQEEIDFAYDEFISIVADGRGLPEAEVRKMATGWAWSGVKAKEMGLVDTLGTYADAIDRAAELGGIDGEPQIVTYDEYSLSDVVGSLIGLTDRLDRIGALGGATDSYGPSVPK